LTTTTSSEDTRHHSKQYFQPYGPRRDRNQVDFLVEENRKLKRRNLVLQTEVSTIKYAIQQAFFKLTIIITTFRELYQTLTKNLPGVLASSVQMQPANLPSMSANSALTSMSTSNVPWDQPLNHNDYPQVRFWFRKDWINRKKETSSVTKVNQSNTFPTTEQNKGRAPSGLNVSLRYVEDVHGAVVDGFRASEMRKFARSIWNQLQGAGKAPRSWGKADLEVAAHYRREMRRRFPELGLCEFDWKAEQLATDNYPNWASNNLHGVKMESSDPSLMHSKRRRDSVDHSSKKAKTETIPPTPIDIDSAPSSNLNAVSNMPVNDLGSTISPANIPPSSVIPPPSIIISQVNTAAPPNFEELRRPNTPADITPVNDPGSTISAANIPPSSVIPPPSIIISQVNTAAPPNFEELRFPNTPVDITSDHPNELPADPRIPIPTGNMAFVDQELGKDDVPTTTVFASDFAPAVAVTNIQELPTQATPAAAAETANSSQAASPPQGASISTMSMPRVCMSLKSLIICS
jgi:hypothetical protein